MSDFQTQVNAQPAPAQAGDFCDKNPRYIVDAGPGGLVAGLSGVTIGRFAWLSYEGVDIDEAPAVVNNYGSGAVAGFVGREAYNALITTYLSDASELVPSGFPIGNLYSGGGFWAENANASAAAVTGNKAYAVLADGTVRFKTTGSVESTSAITASVAASTSSVTGSISDNTMTVTNVGSGVVYPGTTLSGTNVATGTKVVKQLTPLLTGETAGGVGRYAVSIPQQSVASTTISGTYGTMTVTAGSGLVVGGVATAGTGITVGAEITALITGAGGTGTYVLDDNTVVASTADITFSTDVETKWYARSYGAVGELIKMSDQPLG